MFYILWVSRGTLRNIPCSAVFYGETAGASGLSSHEDEQYVDIAWRHLAHIAQHVCGIGILILAYAATLHIEARKAEYFFLKDRKLLV